MVRSEEYDDVLWVVTGNERQTVRRCLREPDIGNNSGIKTGATVSATEISLVPGRQTRCHLHCIQTNSCLSIFNSSPRLATCHNNQISIGSRTPMLFPLVTPRRLQRSSSTSAAVRCEMPFEELPPLSSAVEAAVRINHEHRGVMDSGGDV